MRSIHRFLLSAGVLLLAVPAPAFAESPMPESITPGVLGRPVQEVRPLRRAPPKAVVRRAAAPRAIPAVVATTPAVVAVPAAPAPAPTRATEPARARAVARTEPGAVRAPKKAVDDRADPRMRLDDVGKGTHVARKPLGTGAYIGERHRSAVRKYYQQHPSRVAKRADWKVGEPVPRKARLAAVPRPLLASLPKVPPGYRYVQLGGEVVMIAAGSRMVVDGVSRDEG